MCPITFHFVEDEFCNILWGNIPWIFSCCNLIIRLLFSVYHLNTVVSLHSISKLHNYMKNN